MMLTGVSTLLLMLMHHCLSAPQVSGYQREESAVAPPHATLANPFGPGEDSRRLLQSYIQANLKKDQGGTEIHTREQEVFFLFSLHDYDRSGHMDGLEMMKFISDFNSHNAPGTQSADVVVSMVDFLLQTQDVNQDGLFAPSELLSPPMPQRDSDSHDAPPRQEQEVGMDSEGKLLGQGQEPQQKEHTETRVGEEGKQEEEGEERKRGEESNQGVHHNLEEQLEHGDQLMPEEVQEVAQIPEATAAEPEWRNVEPVHQGQPEM